MKYYTQTEIEKEIYKEIEMNKKLAIKSHMKSYLSWYYPLIKSCFYILVRLDIKSLSECDKEFDEIDKQIRDSLRG